VCPQQKPERQKIIIIFLPQVVKIPGVIIIIVIIIIIITPVFSYQRYRQADHRLLSSHQPVIQPVIQERRLRFFGHVARADFKQNHHRVIEASLRPPSHCRRPCGRPRSTWLRGINSDVQSVNNGIHSAWRKASDRTLWRRIVDTATLYQGARH